MTCKIPSAYTEKESPFGRLTSPFSDIVSPFTKKDTMYADGASPLSPMCFDYVIKIFQDGDFFTFQDGKQFIFNLDNDTL